MSHAGLLKAEAHRFHNMHFLACSNKVSALEMTKPLVEDLCMLVMFDAKLGAPVYVIAPVVCILRDICLCFRATEPSWQ